MSGWFSRAKPNHRVQAASPFDPQMPGLNPGNYIYIPNEAGVLLRVRREDGGVEETQIGTITGRFAYYQRHGGGT